MNATTMPFPGRMAAGRFLSNFKTLTFEFSEANESGINNYSPNGVRHGVHMKNFNNGDDLADPSTIGSDGYFTVTRHHCN